MNGVVICGGKGKELKPLTCSIQKSILPLCERPIIFYALDFLSKNRISEVNISAPYKAEEIKNALGSSLRYKNISLSMNSDYPTDNTTIFIKSTVVCDFDILNAQKFHYSNHADVTIISKEVTNPAENSILFYNNQNKLTEYLTHPNNTDCINNLVDCGIYILSPKALEYVKTNENSPSSLITSMLENNFSIYVYKQTGYWCDVDNIEKYMQCHRDILNSVFNLEPNAHRMLNGILTSSNSEFKDVIINPPVFIGKNVSIAEGTVIEKNTVIGDNVTIGKNCKIRSSILLSGAYIGNRVTCNNCIIGSNAKILHFSSVYEGSVIGNNCITGESSVIESNTRIWPNKHIAENTHASFDIRYGNAKPLIIEDNKIIGDTNSLINPQSASIIGSSIASLGKNIVIGFRGDGSSAKAITFSIISGVLSSGSNIWSMGECIENQLAYAMHTAHFDAGIFINSSSSTYIEIFSKNGLPLTRQDEYTIENGINKKDFIKSNYINFGDIFNATTFKKLYELDMFKISPQLKGLCVQVSTSTSNIRHICENIFHSLNDQNGEKITFNISADGKQVSLYSLANGFIFWENLILVCCKECFENNLDIAVPYNFPSAVNRLANTFRRKVYRYRSAEDLPPDIMHNLCHSFNFMTDGISLTLNVLRIMTERKKSIGQLMNELPAFSSSTRFITINRPPIEILRKLCKQTDSISGGIAKDDDNGRVLLQPTKSGRGLMVYAESFQSETATELCSEFENIINKLK